MGNATYCFDSPTTSNNKRKFKEFTPSIRKLYPKSKKQLLVDLRLSEEASSEIDYTGSTQNYNDSVRYLQQERWKIIHTEINLLEQGRDSPSFTIPEYHTFRQETNQYFREIVKFFCPRRQPQSQRHYNWFLDNFSNYGDITSWSCHKITELVYQYQGLRVVLY